VAANATYDAGFQDRSTRLIGDALPDGGICGHWYALLRDRYLVLSQKPSIYGSSFGAYHDTDGNLQLVEYDVVDPDNLNKRRARVGYEAVEVERLKIAQRSIDENWKKLTYEQCMANFENTSVKGGYHLQ